MYWSRTAVPSSVKTLEWFVIWIRFGVRITLYFNTYFFFLFHSNHVSFESIYSILWRGGIHINWLYFMIGMGMCVKCYVFATIWSAETGHPLLLSRGQSCHHAGSSTRKITFLGDRGWSSTCSVSCGRTAKSNCPVRNSYWMFQFDVIIFCF